MIFQISPLSEQKNNENPNISYIDLGECINFVNIENFCKTSQIPNPQSPFKNELYIKLIKLN